MVSTIAWSNRAGAAVRCSRHSWHSKRIPSGGWSVLPSDGVQKWSQAGGMEGGNAEGLKPRRATDHKADNADAQHI